MSTFNIYVASYKRADTTVVYKLLEYCTYVVRKSEEEDYRKAGIKDILAVDDELICSFAKVQNWIIQNAKEDVVCVLDDDIESFAYCLDEQIKINDKVVATRELERISQLAYDLDIALCGTRIALIPYGYNSEFRFSAMICPVRIYNRKLIKSRYENIRFFGDTDFVLQELLNNRIILRPNYFGGNAKIETNKGGMNIKRTKSIQESIYKTYLKPKWGKYVDFNTKKNITMILVKR